MSRMCQVLGASPSGYYAWRDRPKSQRQQANEALVEQIQQVHAHSLHTYGSPRITEELQAQGVACSANRVARLMKVHGIQVKMKQQFKRTTQSNYNQPIAPNLLQQDFTTHRPNRVWLSDISYIATGQGFEIQLREAELFAIRVNCDAYYACDPPLQTLW